MVPFWGTFNIYTYKFFSAVYRSLPLKGNRPLPLKGNRPLPLKGYRSLPLKGNRPLPLKGYRSLPLEGNRPLPLKGNRIQPLEDTDNCGLIMYLHAYTNKCDCNLKSIFIINKLNNLIVYNYAIRTHKLI